MSVRINTPTNGRDIYTQGVELDGVKYRLRLRWNYRTRGWYMDLMDAAEVAIVSGRRLSPGSMPVPANVPNAPPGVFYITGSLDRYDREDLGASFVLVYMSADEVAAIPDADAEEITVTI